ncbi:small GTP-binding protein [Pyrolobus fumarii 1A]|uniref:Small GTP-binding protein n=1 Tax=Pyrolobus fumarii (strain DSM 11204 / 1A) TaxID=694429 RepID=G0EEA5_PYRF1|nr:TGS domain-containing protein [Pyrolobus fumarii]AEM38799.1 small GTP-binding protein [Pyrolobus fumarii 1A]
MPANLPAEARAKLAKYSEAKTIEEKIKALEEFLAAVPKHKGTENLLLWARRRLAELREELERRKQRRGGGGGPRFFIEKSGAAQLVVLGPPNAGKSLLVQRLTGAKTHVADYPFSTTLPVPGMLQYEDIQFQLIDTPPLTDEAPQYVPRIVGLARNADGVILVVALDRDPVAQYEDIKRILREHGVLIEKPRGVVRVRKGGGPGVKVQLRGRILDGTVADVEKLLASYRIYSAVVEIEGEVTLDDIEEAIFKPVTYKPTLVIANKVDVPGAVQRYKRLYEHLKGRGIGLIPVSVVRNYNLDKIGEFVFRMLRIIRVYTKQPNGEVSKTPLILPKGATVLDAARKIHSDLAKYFTYAKIWGPSAKYPGERVGPDHVLEDGDIVEIHAKR